MEMDQHSDVYCTELTPSRLANFTKVAILANLCTVHCKKRFAIFPSPAGMSLTKLSLAGDNLIIPGQGEFC
jgi:hypothetical protein